MGCSDISEKEESALSSRKRNTRAIVFSFIGIALGIIFYSALLIPTITQAREVLLHGRSNLTSAYSSAIKGELQSARLQFKEARIDFTDADKLLSSNTVTPCRYFPVLGNNIRTVSFLAKAGFHVASAGESLSQTALEVSYANKGTPILSNGRINLALLNSMSTGFNRTSYHVRAADTIYKDIHHSMLVPVIRSACNEFGEQIPKLKRITDTLDGIVPLVSGLLGADGTRRYFLAVQNNAELRATGGIIGNYGIITIDHGKISLEEFDEIHKLQLDSLKPVVMPQEFMVRYGRFKSTSLWLNTNMSPDFSRTGYIVSNLYTNATGVKVDGVISLDPVGLQYLLVALGPVTTTDANHHPYTIDEHNVIDETLVKAYAQYEDRRDRKSYLADVARAVWTRMLSGNTDTMGIMQQIRRALDEKHMIVYSKHAQEQRLLERLGYSGSLKPTSGDYLQVVLQNHGANKLDVYLDQKIDYRVVLNKDGSARAVARISIENKAPVSTLCDYVAGEGHVVPRGYDNTWLSVYVPKTAQLNSARENDRDSQIEVGRELDKTVFSQYVKVAPGTSSTVELVYTLPDVVRSNAVAPGYHIGVQAQPVINTPMLTVTITAPGGFSSIPDGYKRNGEEATYCAPLIKDIEFDFNLTGALKVKR
ncbi:MAG TPA: DUF4012 domain-containing protein [Candidatus Aquicultor sp.]|jgi:hypothetical protein